MIVIEGIDGSGKTTIAKYISKKYTLQFYKFPVYKDFKILKDFLNGKKNISEEAAFLLFLSNVLINTKDKEGVYDRYVFSSIAYAYCFDIKNAMRIVNSLPFIKPDVLIYVDIDPLISLERKSKKTYKANIRENEKILSVVRDRYLYMAKRNFMVKWNIIDSSKSLDNVIMNVENVIEHYLKKRMK